MKRKLSKLFALIILASTLTACGVKGNLTLPEGDEAKAVYNK